jgi:hypothetical protein
MCLADRHVAALIMHTIVPQLSVSRVNQGKTSCLDDRGENKVTELVSKLCPICVALVCAGSKILSISSLWRMSTLRSITSRAMIFGELCSECFPDKERRRWQPALQEHWVSQWQCRLGPSRNGQWRCHYGDASVVTVVATWGVAFAASHTELDVKRAKLRLWQRRGYHGHYRWRGKANGLAAAKAADGKVSFPSVWRRKPSVLWPKPWFGPEPRLGSRKWRRTRRQPGGGLRYR